VLSLKLGHSLPDQYHPLLEISVFDHGIFLALEVLLHEILDA